MFVSRYPTAAYLGGGVGPDFRTAVDVHRLIHVLINLKDDSGTLKKPNDTRESVQVRGLTSLTALQNSL